MQLTCGEKTYNATLVLEVQQAEMGLDNLEGYNTTPAYARNMDDEGHKISSELYSSRRHKQ